MKEEKNKKKKVSAKEKKTEVKEKKVDVFANGKILIVALFCLVIGIIIGVFANDNKTDKVEPRFQNFINVFNDIEKNYYGEINDDFDENMVVSMVKKLNDPNAIVYEGLDAVNYKETVKNKFIGIGTEVTMDENNNIIFTNVFSDSPASRAGVQVNDRLIKVNGQDVTGMALLDAISLIKGGNEKDLVEITVLRDNEEKVISIEKAIIIRDTVSLEYLNNDIAKLSINYFANSTYEEVKEKLDEIKEKGIKKLALDLRNNYFGSIDTARNIAELFLDKGQVIYKEVTREGTKDYKTKNNKEYDFKIVLVTNEFTSQASEMLSYSLIDNLGVKVIGKNTASNNSIQKTYELTNHVVEFTIGKWLSPKGNDVKENGIIVDYTGDNIDINNRIVEAMDGNVL